jgi:hypothetical protein
MNDFFAGPSRSVGFELPNPFKVVKKAAAGTVRSVKRFGKDPLRGAGTVANLAPGAALALSGGGLGLLAKKGATELARRGGAPEVLTTFADPSGHITHGVAAGARAGMKKKGLAGLFGGALKGGVKSGHDVSKNPLIRATAAGLTFVMPPAGIALSGGLAGLDKGLAVADKLVGAYEHGDATVKKTVASLYARTAALAKTGDVGAKAALVALAGAKKKLEAMRAYTYFVATNGRITRGKFSKVSSGGQVGFYVRADGHIERGMFRAG